MSTIATITIDDQASRPASEMYLRFISLLEDSARENRAQATKIRAAGLGKLTTSEVEKAALLFEGLAEKAEKTAADLRAKHGVFL